MQVIGADADPLRAAMIFSKEMLLGEVIAAAGA